MTTFDNKYILSAGGGDGIVNMWSFSAPAFEAHVSLSPPGMEPFLNLLDPSGAGEKGAIYREMEDYFYYAQLRRYGQFNLIVKTIGPVLLIKRLFVVLQPGRGRNQRPAN